jgi:hypothetical protein
LVRNKNPITTSWEKVNRLPHSNTLDSTINDNYGVLGSNYTIY